MRHHVNKKTLNRTKDQRNALFTGMASELIQHGRINTTLAKAKVMRPYVEKLVTKAVRANKSEDKLAKFNTIKLLRKSLRSDLAISLLMENVAKSFEKRPGGYTRIVKTGQRGGDNSDTARLEFVENIQPKVETKKEKPSKVKKEKAPAKKEK